MTVKRRWWRSDPVADPHKIRHLLESGLCIVGAGGNNHIVWPGGGIGGDLAEQPKMTHPSPTRVHHEGAGHWYLSLFVGIHGPPGVQRGAEFQGEGYRRFGLCPVVILCSKEMVSVGVIHALPWIAKSHSAASSCRVR